MRVLAGLGLALMLAASPLSSGGAARSAAAAEAPINSIVAIVNDEAITLSQVRRYARLLSNRGAISDDAAATNNANDVTAAERAALDELINRALQLQRAEQLGIVITDVMLDNRMDEFAAQFELNTDAQWLAFADAQFGVDTIASLRENAREDMRIQALFYRDVYVRTQVYEEEIEAFVRRNTERVLQTRYLLGHILLPLTDDGRALADDLRERIRKGEDHVALAQEFSADAASRESGDLGYRTVDELPFAFADEAQNLEVGGVGQVIETSRGYHILKLLAVDRQKDVERVVSYLLQHIFLALDDAALGDQAHEELRAGADFVELVRRYSIDTVSVPNDGALGWFSAEDVPPYFADAVAGLNVGEYSAPIESPFGFHIVRLADRQEREIDLQILRDRARRVLQERRALTQRQVWLQRLRANAYIRVVDPDFAEAP